DAPGNAETDQCSDQIIPDTKAIVRQRVGDEYSADGSFCSIEQFAHLQPAENREGDCADEKCAEQNPLHSPTAAAAPGPYDFKTSSLRNLSGASTAESSS